MDAGHDYTDERIEAIAEQVRSIYAEASASAEKSLSEWLERFAEKDEERRAAVESGDATKEDWQRWRRMQMIQGRRWRAIAEQMAEGFTGANEQAAQIISGELPAIAAENANWGTFSVEKAAGVSTSFALQDAGTIHALLSEAAGLSVATVAVNEAADIAWNRKGIQSQITQGIMLGESIPKIAKRMERVGATNKAQAIRWARTFTAAAEGAGRIASYKRAIAMGIKLKHQWEATLDDRTRHSHRQVDGEVREVGERFSNGCRYTGDPSAPYSEICNCRCALRPVLEGVDQSDSERWSKLPEGMTYEQWKGWKSQEDARGGRPSLGITHDAKYAVNTDAVKSNEYRSKLKKVFGQTSANAATTAARAMLRHRGGTDGEDLYAINLDTGRVISSVTTSETAREVLPTQAFLKKVKAAREEGAKVATMHNHPGSSIPSAADILSLDMNGFEFGAIACHDGSIFVYRRVSEGQKGYNMNDFTYNGVCDAWVLKGEASVFAAIEERFGVRIEHIA